ncbi:hypothetical protein RJT34_25341 [Clitoria ternatea]|uniref:Reverse transcriptase zinc-binding domain-containing protein n=1 Tax=Clitoria ternatea TaxID=43366 RepID=A0AAN9FRN3_CLITE
MKTGNTVGEADVQPTTRVKDVRVYISHWFDPVNSVDGKEFPNGEMGFGPWMLVERGLKKKKSVVITERDTRGTNESESRFHALCINEDVIMPLHEMDVVGSRNEQLLRLVFNEGAVQKIMSLHPFVQGTKDGLVWFRNKHGMFSLGSMYEAITNRISIPKEVFKKIWKWWGPQRITFILWRLAGDSLPTNGLWARRHIALDSSCPLCGCQNKTTLHMVHDCNDVNDSSKAVEMLEIGVGVTNQHSDLIRQIIDVANSIDCVIWIHIPCEANQVANILAKYGLQEDRLEIWDEFPLFFWFPFIANYKGK